jgi:hypothetical protein
MLVAACTGTPTLASQDAAARPADAASEMDAKPDVTMPPIQLLDAGTDAPPPAPAPSGFCVGPEYEYDAACGDNHIDPQNCGSCGHDCKGGECENGECLPLPAGALATGQGFPLTLAVDDTFVYWLDWGGPTRPGPYGSKSPGPVRVGAVMRCAKTGCENAPTVLAPNQCLGRSLAVDGSSVYWTTLTGLFQCSKSGCSGTPAILSSDDAAALAIDSSNAYFIDLALGAIVQVALTGGPKTILATGLSLPFAIAVDATNVYWTDAGNVLACSKTGCGNMPTVLASGQSAPDAILSDGQTVFFTNDTASSMGAILACSVGGCGGEPTIFAAGQNNPVGLAFDGTFLYWTTIGSGEGSGIAPGQVVSCPITGCGSGPTVVGAGLNLPYGYTQAVSIAVDATSVYWSGVGNSPDAGFGGQDMQVRFLAK